MEAMRAALASATSWRSVLNFVLSLVPPTLVFPVELLLPMLEVTFLVFTLHELQAIETGLQYQLNYYKSNATDLHSLRTSQSHPLIIDAKVTIPL